MLNLLTFPDFFSSLYFTCWNVTIELLLQISFCKSHWKEDGTSFNTTSMLFRFLAQKNGPFNPMGITAMKRVKINNFSLNGVVKDYPSESLSYTYPASQENSKHTKQKQKNTKEWSMQHNFLFLSSVTCR